MFSNRVKGSTDVQAGCNAFANVTAGDNKVVTGKNSNPITPHAPPTMSFNGQLVQRFW